MLSLLTFALEELNLQNGGVGVGGSSSSYTTATSNVMNAMAPPAPPQMAMSMRGGGGLMSVKKMAMSESSGMMGVASSMDAPSAMSGASPQNDMNSFSGNV